MMTMVLAAAMTLPMVKQTVTTEWPDAAAAKRATAEVVMLGEGGKFVFSGRWDDRNVRSLAVSKALSPLGFRSTFYTNGRSNPKYAELMRELVAAGDSIGCHTITHDFMCRLLPTKSFREILENRIELEVDSQSPVVTLSMPYGQGAAGSPIVGFDNIKVVGQAASNAGLLGGADGSGGATAAFGLSDDDWAGTYVFSANDNRPDAALFWKGFSIGTNLVARGKLPAGPNVNLGIHPWQTDEGLVDLASLTKEAMATPGAVMMNENGYVASWMQYRRTTVRKSGTKGKRAFFEIERPHPGVLGADVPLNLRLSDGRFVKVGPPKKGPSTFSRIDGALAVSDDDTTFTLAFTNTTGHSLANVVCALRLPPGYEPGVVWKSVRSVAPGKCAKVVFKSVVPSDPLFREGTLFAAVEINADGCRIWAPVEKSRPSTSGRKGPRDVAVVRGFIPVAEVPSDAELAALSDPKATLDGDWHLADGSADGDAAWAIACFRQADRDKVKRLPWSAPPPGTGTASLLVLDFQADTAAHGGGWECLYGGGGLQKDRVRSWLNGSARGFPAGPVAPRKGRNRLVVLTSGLNYKMLFPMISLRSVKDGASVDWLPAN